MRSQTLFRKRMIFRSSLLFCMVLTVSTGWASATEVFLRADTTTMIMPDGRNVEMWGFALDSAFGAQDGTVMVPGPTLEVALGEDLIIHLDNNLDVPVSIVIPSLNVLKVKPIPTLSDDVNDIRLRTAKIVSEYVIPKEGILHGLQGDGPRLKSLY